MTAAARFPYAQVVSGIGRAGWMPMVPVELELGGVVVAESALVDSGAAVSIMPYQLGVQLGGDWNQYQGTFPLGGAFAGETGKPLFVRLRVASFPAIRMIFAWTMAAHARLLLGQTNFFQEFDVCFFGAKHEFQVQPRTP